MRLLSSIVLATAGLSLALGVSAAEAARGDAPAARVPLSRKITAQGGQVRHAIPFGVSRPIEVSVISGDVTRMPVEGVVVPHFERGASWGGVGAAVARAGAQDGIEAYEHTLASAPTKFGSVRVTSSRNVPWKLINVASVGSGRAHEYETVARSTYAAMDAASRHGLTSIAMPLLGTGIIGELTAEQSARAMMGSIHSYQQAARPGQVVPDVALVVFRDPHAVESVAGVLARRSYPRQLVDESGRREFDAGRWLREIHTDWLHGPGAGR